MTDDPLKAVLDNLAAEAEQRWGFTYCECPDCEFSVVVATADLAGGAFKVACSMCWQDSGHEIAMTTRPATDADKPEGADARYRPMHSFKCSSCGNDCLSDVTDAEAQAEFEELYGQPLDRAKHPAICDDCHKRRMAARLDR